MTQLNSILKECNPSITTPTGTKYTNDELQAYIQGVQINSSTSSKFRFNLVSGADISDLKFLVDGSERDYVVSEDGSYVELSLRAYEMTHDITITVGGKTGTYNLYTYYAALADKANASVSGASAIQKESEKALEFIKALYTYATVADKYLDAKN